MFDHKWLTLWKSTRNIRIHFVYVTVFRTGLFDTWRVSREGTAKQ